MLINSHVRDTFFYSFCSVAKNPWRKVNSLWLTRYNHMDWYRSDRISKEIRRLSEASCPMTSFLAFKSITLGLKAASKGLACHGLRVFLCYRPFPGSQSGRRWRVGEGVAYYFSAFFGRKAPNFDHSTNQPTFASVISVAFFSHIKNVCVTPTTLLWTLTVTHCKIEVGLNSRSEELGCTGQKRNCLHFDTLLRKGALLESPT